MLGKTIRAGPSGFDPRSKKQSVANARGWHGWLFRLRLQQAYAKLALARAYWPAAVAFATAALGHSRASGRRKYEASALTTRARAQYALGPNTRSYPGRESGMRDRTESRRSSA